VLLGDLDWAEFTMVAKHVLITCCLRVANVLLGDLDWAEFTMIATQAGFLNVIQVANVLLTCC
jgi:hypothetical protein